MRYLSLGEVMNLHLRIIDRTGGGRGIRDLGALESRAGAAQGDLRDTRTPCDAAGESRGALLLARQESPVHGGLHAPEWAED